MPTWYGKVAPFSDFWHQKLLIDSDVGFVIKFFIIERLFLSGVPTVCWLCSYFSTKTAEGTVHLSNLLVLCLGRHPSSCLLSLRWGPWTAQLPQTGGGNLCCETGRTDRVSEELFQHRGLCVLFAPSEEWTWTSAPYGDESDIPPSNKDIPEGN